VTDPLPSSQSTAMMEVELIDQHRQALHENKSHHHPSDGRTLHLRNRLKNFNEHQSLTR
jgi:hypothetical protein